MGFENHVDGNVVVLDESRRPHLKRGGILRYLTPVLVVMERVEEDKVEVVKRVERVLVLVLGEIRLDTVDAARLWDDLCGRESELAGYEIASQELGTS